MDDLIAKMDLLCKQFADSNYFLEVCEYCGGAHSSIQCQVGNRFAQSQYEEAYFVENYNWQNDPYSYNYNQEWRDHANFSWNGPYNTVNPSIMNPMNQEMNQWPYQPPEFQQSNQAPEPEQKSSLEIALEDFENTTRNFIAKVDAYMVDEERLAIQRYVDEQMELLLNSSNSKPHDASPSNIETYPEEDEGFATLQDGNEMIEAQMEEPLEEKVEEPIEAVENQWPDPFEEKPNMEVFLAIDPVDPRIEEPLERKVEEEIEPMENKLPGPFEEQPMMEIFLVHNPVDPFEEYLVRIADSDKQKISKYLSSPPQIFTKGELEESEKGVAQRVTYVEQSHLMKLKPLPTHVRYVFLGASYETARMFKEQYLNNLVDPD